MKHVIARIRELQAFVRIRTTGALDTSNVIQSQARVYMGKRTRPVSKSSYVAQIMMCFITVSLFLI